MRATVFRALVATTVAVLLGLGSAWWILQHPWRSHLVAVGPWRTSLVAGSIDADLYTRARVALTGLFALDRKETLYFEATSDDTGARLRAECTYVVTGRPLAARWWSITAYGGDHFLIPNDTGRYSFNMGNLPPEADGSFRIVVGRTRSDGNWLPTGKSPGAIELTARLYNPARSVADDPTSVHLPSIARRGDCP